jgi:spermidine synthase|tara:strand:+ start:2189 stop:3178 length:990 start_codon:yes stop_codon:yes gene_type:complete
MSQLEIRSAHKQASRFSHKPVKSLWTVLAALLVTCIAPSVTGASKTVIHEERSLYTSILVQQQRDLLCLNFTLKRADSSQSCMDVKNPKRMVFAYTRMVMSGLLFTPNPKNIMIVGLGGGTLPVALNEILPEAKIQTVEIDPAVIGVAKRFFNFTESANNKIIQQDARVFAKRAALQKQQFDLIILDAFNGDYIPEHLMTQEFLTEVQSLLTPGGVLVANTFASSDLYAHESNTYKEVFGKFINLRGRDSGNRIVIVPQGSISAAQRAPISRDSLLAQADILAPVLAPYAIPIKRLAKDILKSINAPADWDQDKRTLTDQYSPANLLKN